MSVMKKLAIIAVLIAPFHSILAVEYFTLSNSAKTVTVAPNSLVEVVGFTNWARTTDSTSVILAFTLANGDVISGPLIGGYTSGSDFPVQILKQKFTNVTQIRIYGLNGESMEGAAATLKVTPASEIESAGPKTVMVIPEGSTGDFDVVIESSGDMVTWTPMHSQTVSGSGPKTFFRTRIVKK